MGRIAAPHGIRGWLKVVPWSQDPAALIAHKVWWVKIALPRESLAPPAANEYYWSDLEGMDVVNRSGMPLGRVAALTESGAHPLLHVVSGPGTNERLIPFVPAYIDRIDVAARRIDVDWEADY